MRTFDASSREVCTARRERTATPLQSLVLLNDPQFVEATRVLAEKLIQQPDSNLESRIRQAYRLLTSRLPSPKEIDILKQLYHDQKTYFDSVPNEAKQYLSIGESPRDERLDPTEHAAMTVLISNLFNYDESFTKR